MLPLRYSQHWRIGGVVLLTLVLAGTLLPAFSIWPRTTVRYLMSVDKWIHGLMFLFLTLWYSGQYARPAYWRIGAGLIVFGGVIELIQRILPFRSGDPADMAANAAGIVAGFVLAFAGFGGWSVRVERWLEARQSSKE